MGKLKKLKRFFSPAPSSSSHSTSKTGTPLEVELPMSPPDTPAPASKASAPRLRNLPYPDGAVPSSAPKGGFRTEGSDTSGPAGSEWEEAYCKRVEAARASDYPQLKDITYLDHAAAPPAPASLIRLHGDKLTGTLYANPHSKSPSSMATHHEIERARAVVLKEMFGIVNNGVDNEGWDIVWTSGATAGLKLVGESFDFDNGSPECDGGEYRYLQEAHTSLVGVRDLAATAGATVSSFHLDDLIAGSLGSRSSPGARLVAMPLQCNATGRQYLSQLSALRTRLAREHDPATYVLLDAAGYISAHQTGFNLGSLPYTDAPDFIAFSFYKGLAYPTGLGGLVVKRSSTPMLRRKPYYGGGTVEAITAVRLWRAPRGMRDGIGVERFTERMEDGTINFQGIIAVPLGLQVLEDLFGPVEERKRYVRLLTRRLFQGLLGMKHSNGKPVVRIYTTSAIGKALIEGRETSLDDPAWDQGAAVNFNVLKPTGWAVAPADVERLACAEGIHLRHGRHCNSGVMVSLVGGTDDEIFDLYSQGYSCEGVGEVINKDGGAWASVRASLGASNTKRDCDKLVETIRRAYVDFR